MRKREKKDAKEGSTEHQHKMRERTPKRKGPSVGALVFLGIFGVIILYSAVVALSGNGTGNVDPDFNYEALSECILESEAIFYGTEWCQYCNQQKDMLGPTFQEHGDEFFVDCDLNQNECRAAGVQSYPSWYIDGRLIPGVQSLDRLASEMGCAL